LGFAHESGGRGGSYNNAPLMNEPHLSPSERIIEPMIALARCSKLQRIIVAGSKSFELMFELERRGYVHVATAANCGRAAAQYEIALIDLRRRGVKNLEPTLDWLAHFLSPTGVLVVWSDPQKPEAREGVCAVLEGRGFVIEDRTIRDDGFAYSARQRVRKPSPQAA
jgi:hypothetical protein